MLGRTIKSNKSKQKELKINFKKWPGSQWRANKTGLICPLLVVLVKSCGYGILDKLKTGNGGLGELIKA